MSHELLDANVLTIASAPQAGWVHPRIPLHELVLIQKVFDWVREFREASDRKLVLDEGMTILEEYTSPRNMPEFQLYGRQVVQHKFSTNAVTLVPLAYWNNGFERVARLTDELEALVHDLGDRKWIAAALAAQAVLVNACDSDWSNEREATALRLAGIQLVQILTDTERERCRQRHSPTSP